MTVFSHQIVVPFPSYLMSVAAVFGEYTQDEVHNYVVWRFVELSIANVGGESEAMSMARHLLADKTPTADDDAANAYFCGTFSQLFSEGFGTSFRGRLEHFERVSTPTSAATIGSRFKKSTTLPRS